MITAVYLKGLRMLTGSREIEAMFNCSQSGWGLPAKQYHHQFLVNRCIFSAQANISFVNGV